jgi:hypothetical protein
MQIKHRRAAAAAGLIVATFAVVAVASAGAGSLNRSQDPAPEYPTNGSGMTYGSLSDAVSPQTEPDLVAAVGDNGEEGYVKSSDIAPTIPLNPEAAVRAQNSDEYRKSKKVPLYAVDGSTVIGTFTLTPPADAAAGAELH